MADPPPSFPVKELGLPKATTAALLRNDIDSVYKLSRCTREFLIRIPGINGNSLKKVVKVLAEFGEALREKPTREFPLVYREMPKPGAGPAVIEFPDITECMYCENRLPRPVQFLADEPESERVCSQCLAGSVVEQYKELIDLLGSRPEFAEERRKAADSMEWFRQFNAG